MTNGSKTGLSFVLLQSDQDNKLKPVAYGSRTLQPEQRNWPIMHIELFAIIMGITENKCYLMNKRFTIIITDCKSLTWLTNKSY
jgi:hypothetical protein